MQIEQSRIQSQAAIATQTTKAQVVMNQQKLKTSRVAKAADIVANAMHKEHDTQHQKSQQFDQQLHQQVLADQQTANQPTKETKE